MKQEDTMGFMFMLVIISIFVCLILWLFAAIGAVNNTTGCMYRYSFIGDDVSTQTLVNEDVMTQDTTLAATGNYSLIQSTEGGALEPDPNEYGKWVSTNIAAESDDQFEVEVRGEVSLCKAYVPNYNLTQESGLDSNGEKIAIPRIEDADSEPLSLVFNATTDEWRNITELFPDDRYVVSILPNRKTSTEPAVRIETDIFGNSYSDSCGAEKDTYEPICGRFSIYSGEIVESCIYETQCCKKDCEERCGECCEGKANGTKTCDGVKIGWFAICTGNKKTTYSWCPCWENVTNFLPEDYQIDGSNSFAWSDDFNNLRQNYTETCLSCPLPSPSPDYVCEINDVGSRKFWYSADDAAGLLYRYDSSEDPTSKTELGSNYQFAQIKDYGDETSFYGSDSDYNVLIDDTCDDVATCGSEGIHYLQYRFISEDPADYVNHTGGYVLNIKQTKCIRSNGVGTDDTVANRGAIEYVIMPYEQDPNETTPDTVETLSVSGGGKGTISVPSDTEGYIWMRIKNDENDYVDSFGQYIVEFTVKVPRDSFYNTILEPLVTTLKTKIQNAAETIFKNMTCYKGAGEEGNCTNFFDYIRAMLTLYVMAYGFLFLLGNVQISQTDIVIRVIKIAFVAGLMNEQTFAFFKDYVFDFVTGFSDDIISNMGGYSVFTANSTINNPFSFLSSVLNKVFLSKTFAAQMMALLSLGMNGVLYFIIIFVTLIMLIIVLFRAITVYMMAFMALAVLIGLAPLFLTFMLFKFTFHLFDNWIKFTFRYMVEPVIMLAGIIILTQLFTIYLDQVIGYSICWKCLIPVKIPFPGVLDVIFTDIEIFCINWFAPWGFDQRTGQMGLNMQHIATLVMLAYALWNYIEFSGRIVANIVSAGGPSASRMGGAMSKPIGQKMLGKVGLDANTRKQIKDKAKQRLKDLSQGKARATLNKDNRFDVAAEDDKKDGKRTDTEGQVDKKDGKRTDDKDDKKLDKAKAEEDAGRFAPDNKDIAPAAGAATGKDDANKEPEFKQDDEGSSEQVARAVTAEVKDDPAKIVEDKEKAGDEKAQDDKKVDREKIGDKKAQDDKDDKKGGGDDGKKGGDGDQGGGGIGAAGGQGGGIAGGNANVANEAGGQGSGIAGDVAKENIAADDKPEAQPADDVNQENKDVERSKQRGDIGGDDEDDEEDELFSAEDKELLRKGLEEQQQEDLSDEEVEREIADLQKQVDEEYGDDDELSEDDEKLLKDFNDNNKDDDEK